MKCTCKNCVFHAKDDNGIMCGKKLCYVEPENTCEDWDSDEPPFPVKLASFAIMGLVIVIICTAIL